MNAIFLNEYGERRSILVAKLPLPAGCIEDAWLLVRDAFPTLVRRRGIDSSAVIAASLRQGDRGKPYFVDLDRDNSKSSAVRWVDAR